jgi:hypothetical protein
MNNLSVAQWCFLILIVGAAAYFAKPAMKWWRRRPWHIKGFPLRGATAIVESITPLPSQPGTNETGDDPQDRQYFLMSVTIKPISRAVTVPWTPSALQVVPAERWRHEEPDNRELDRYCRIESIELVCGSISFVPDEVFAVVGQFDLRIRISARHDIRVIQFRYYLEQFGVVLLPAPEPAMLESDGFQIHQQAVPAGRS